MTKSTYELKLCLTVLAIVLLSPIRSFPAQAASFGPLLPPQIGSLSPMTGKLSMVKYIAPYLIFFLHLLFLMAILLCTIFRSAVVWNCKQRVYYSLCTGLHSLSLAALLLPQPFYFLLPSTNKTRSICFCTYIELAPAPNRAFGAEVCRFESPTAYNTFPTAYPPAPQAAELNLEKLLSTKVRLSWLSLAKQTK